MNITSNGSSTSNYAVNLQQVASELRSTLLDVMKKYAVPDPKIVSKLPKGGIQLDFVGHADITRILIEIDSMWYWEPIKFDDDGLPAYRVENGMAHMAGRLVIHGVERIAIGSAPHNKPDLLKELLSDFLRNGAMRFGISLNLWTKNEWEDLGGAPAPVKSSRGMATPAPASKKPAIKQPLSDEQIQQFKDACAAKGIDPAVVAKNAGIDEGRAWVEADLAALRTAFKDLVSFQEGK